MTDKTYWIENRDAIEYIKDIRDNSVQCIICDPPFGINEDTFEKHYARNHENVLSGYTPAPSTNEEYYQWACKWIHQFPRILKTNGSAYIICAWNHVCDIEQAVRTAPSPGLSVVNHIIWKYNFGVYTRNKFVSSHYHILRLSITDKIPDFYNLAYYNETDKTLDGHSLQYADMEDVWYIKKEYTQGETRNINKLPNALIEKIIRYSTKYGDVICDLFMGNFTTAYVGLSLGRKIYGSEINTESYNLHMPFISNIKFPDEKDTPILQISKKPKYSGKKITDEELSQIKKRYLKLTETISTKKERISILEREFERGHFSIVNILKSLDL